MNPTPAAPERRAHPPRNKPNVQMQSSAWERELNKMIGREVTVTQFVGTNREGLPLYLDHEGVCVALQFTHLSVVLMTEDDKIALRNVASIKRKRSRNNPLKAPASDSTAAILGEVLSDAMKRAPE